MDIRFENVVKKKFFCNIQVGECFAVDLYTPNAMVCMRICLDHNAVELQTGEIVCFTDDDEVVPLDAELKVRQGG
jgi:hypothetical protein